MLQQFDDDFHSSGEELKIPSPEVSESLLGVDSDLDLILDSIDIENDEDVAGLLGSLLDG